MDEVPNDVKSNLGKMYLSKREKSRKTVSKFSLVNYKNIYYNDLSYDEYMENNKKERKNLQFEMLRLNMNENLTNDNICDPFKSASTVLKYAYVDNNCIFYTLIEQMPTTLGKSYSENDTPFDFNATKHHNNIFRDRQRQPSVTNLFKRRSVFTIPSNIQNTSSYKSEEIIIEEKQFLIETIPDKRKELANCEQNIIVNLNEHTSFYEFSNINFGYVLKNHRSKSNIAKTKELELPLKNCDAQYKCSDRFHITNKTSDVSGKSSLFNFYKFKNNGLFGGRKLIFSNLKELDNILFIKKKWNGNKSNMWFHIMRNLCKKINYALVIKIWRIKECIRLKKKIVIFKKRDLNFKHDVSNYIYKTATYNFFPSVFKTNSIIIGWSLGKFRQILMFFWFYTAKKKVVQFYTCEFVKICRGCTFISTRINKHELLINGSFNAGDFVNIESFIPEIYVPAVITERLKDVSSLKAKSVPLPCRSQKKKQQQQKSCIIKKSPCDSQCDDGSVSSKSSNTSQSSACSGRKKKQKKPKKVKKAKVEKCVKKRKCFSRCSSKDSRSSRSSGASSSSVESCGSGKSKKKKIRKRKKSKKCKTLKQKGSGSDVSCKSSECSRTSSCSSVCQEEAKKPVSGWSKLCPCSPSGTKVNECQQQQKPCVQPQPGKCRTTKPSCSSKFFAKLKSTISCATPRPSCKTRKQKCDPGKKKRLTSINGKFRVTADYDTGKIDIDVDKKSRLRLISILNQFSDEYDKCRK